MEKLLTFLNSLTKDRRATFVSSCATSESYLRKAISTRQRLGLNLCIPIERESNGAIVCEDLRPDVDWAFLRSKKTSVAKNSRKSSK